MVALPYKVTIVHCFNQTSHVQVCIGYRHHIAPSNSIVYIYHGDLASAVSTVALRYSYTPVNNKCSIIGYEPAGLTVHPPPPPE